MFEKSEIQGPFLSMLHIHEIRTRAVEAINQSKLNEAQRRICILNIDRGDLEKYLCKILDEEKKDGRVHSVSEFANKLAGNIAFENFGVRIKIRQEDEPR